MASVSAVLLQIDPTQAIKTAETLGTGSAQMILAFLCVALAVALGWAIWRVISEIKGCNAVLLDVFLKKIDSDTKLGDAIKGSNEVNRAALDALRSVRP